MQIKLSIVELADVLKWCKSNSADVYMLATLEQNRLELRISTPDGEVVKITLFDMDTNIQAKINKENYLKYCLPK